MVMFKGAIAVALPPSVALTNKVKLPKTPLAIVPVKVRLNWLKLSQLGKGLPLSSLAV
nr:hypothetical protein [Microseira wollei]